VDETQSAASLGLVRQSSLSDTLLDAGDYVVKSRACSTDIEITFTSDELFDSFKRVLLQRYSSLQWSKFQHRDCTNITLSFKRVLLQRYSSLQWSKFQHRDCTNITLESGKTATVHMWQQDKRSVWLSGDGNQDWYNNEFQELHADAAVGKVPSGTLISIMHRFVFDGSHCVFVSLTFVLLNLACAC